jgi:hypothetical protein
MVPLDRHAPPGLAMTMKEKPDTGKLIAELCTTSSSRAPCCTP